MLPWRQAWDRALYHRPEGFYLRPEGPAGHFRTASHAAPDELAGAIARLAEAVGAHRIMDVGAGRGELAASLSSIGWEDVWAVDVVDRPSGLTDRVKWTRGLDGLPEDAFEGALVVAWELLDVVPLTVLEVDEDGQLRTVLVEPRTGREELGPPPEPEDRAWAAQWWPVAMPEPGERVEVGRSRDLFWHRLTRHPRTRAALCVDYAHTRDGRPPSGSLTGFRSGRAVPPRPDGTMDITAHVAIDSIAPGAAVTTQAQALAELGVSDPDLLDEGGLGGFAWLLQTF